MTALIGREQEFEAVKSYVSKWLNEGESTCLFVNGVPGTGKTATVNEIVKSFKAVETSEPKKRGVKRKTDSPFKHIYVNCHGLTKQLEFCTAIYAALKNDKPKKFTALTAMNQIEKILMETKCLMVLDEIDSLRAMGSALFSKVFTWPEKSDGNVFIIGISNLLNIVDSCLPKRYAGCKPSTVTFKAYSSQQIISILMERLKSKMEESETKAIELCAKKVASMTGDIRRAFDLADRMINMRPTNEEPQMGLSTPRKRKHSNDENMPPSTPKTPRTPASACRDALKLISQVEASPIVRAKLPFQPKFILACILRLLSMGRGIGKAQTLTDQQVFDICERVSKKLKFESCPPEGIKEALDILCMQGMIKVGKDRKIRVTVQVTFALSAIADNGLIAQINDESLKMRPLTDDETEKLFEKLAKYIGENIKLLLENDDRVYCFRLHRDRVYYADEHLMRTAAIVARKDLVSFGTCLGKFTKGGKFFLHITALEYLAPYAKAKVWLKPAAEQQFLYGNNILKSGVARLTEGSEARQGAIVYSIDDKPLGFGVLSKGASECRHADPTTIVILHQADLGEYIRNEEGLT